MPTIIYNDRQVNSNVGHIVFLCSISLCWDDEPRLEYEKLHRALKKSHEQEKRLIKKCRELNGEIVNNAAKVQTALKLSQEDQTTIGSLRKEIEKAWTMVDVAHEKEGKHDAFVRLFKLKLALHCYLGNKLLVYRGY